MELSVSNISISVSKGDAREDLPMFLASMEDASSRSADGIRPESISDETIQKDDELLETYKVLSDAIPGGMGSVWKVHHRSWNVELAMKRPQPRFFAEGSEARKEEFIKECENWINLGLHPNIVSCYYVREVGGVPTIFSEWMDHGSLRDRIRDGSLYGEDAEEVIQERILDIAIQTARGLSYSHGRNLVHQDVKPGNILLTTNWDAKVADFGLAKAESQLTENRKPVSAGYTPEYCPKEQMEGAAPEKWMDVYAWAVTVLEMYAGRRMWAAGAEVKERFDEYSLQCPHTVPGAVRSLLRACLSEGIDDFRAVEKTLKDVYEELCGYEYRRQEPANASDTAGTLNNRALSMLDLGKKEEAHRLWELAENTSANHLYSVYNHGLFLWREGIMDDEFLLERLQDTSWDDTSEKQLALDAVKEETGTWELTEEKSFPERNPFLAPRNSQHESRDGDIFVSAAQNDFYLWSGTRYALIREFEKEKNPLAIADSRDLCAVSGDGKMLVLIRNGLRGDSSANVVIYSIDKDETRTFLLEDTMRNEYYDAVEDKTLREYHRYNVNCMAVSSDGKAIYAGLDASKLVAFTCAGESVFEAVLKEEPFCLSLDADTGRIAAGERDGYIQILDKTGKCIETFRGRSEDVDSVWLDSSRLAYLENGRIKLRDLNTGKCSSALSMGNAGLHARKYLQVWLDEENRVHLWNDLGSETVYTLKEGEQAAWLLSRPLTVRARSKEDSRFEALCGLAEQSIRDGRIAEAFRALSEARSIEGYSQNRRLLDLNERAGEHERRIGIRGVYPGAALPKPGYVQNTFLFNDGRFFIMRRSSSETLYQYDLSGKLLSEWSGRGSLSWYEGGEKYDIDAGAWGAVFVAGNVTVTSSMNTVQFYRTGSFGKIAGFYTDQNRTDRFMISDDRSILAAYSYNINCRDIYLYSIHSEEEVSFLRKIPTTDVVFDISADGTRLLTGHKGGNDLSVWDIADGSLLNTRKIEDTKAEGRIAEGARFTESSDTVLFGLHKDMHIDNRSRIIEASTSVFLWNLKADRTRKLGYTAMPFPVSDRGSWLTRGRDGKAVLFDPAAPDQSREWISPEDPGIIPETAVREGSRYFAAPYTDASGEKNDCVIWEIDWIYEPDSGKEGK